MTRTPRPTQPRRWTTLAVASVTLAAAPAFADLRSAPITLTSPDARIWLAEQGGEAGEAGTTANASNDAAYLAKIGVVEGHMLAARNLYVLGQKANAVALSTRPQEEGSLADLVRQIKERGAADPSVTIAAFTSTMAKNAPIAEVDASLTAVAQAFAAATALDADEVRARFDAVVLLLKAAADEYSASIENGAVADVMGWHEAHSFVALARQRLTDLAALPLSAAASAKASTALTEADAAFGDPTSATPFAGDPQILLGIAAKVELIASSVR